MGTTFHGTDYIKSFIRNISKMEKGSSDRLARQFSRELEISVKNRVSQGIYLGGIWENKPYSRNPIRAYKLARNYMGAQVVEDGLGGKQLYIDDIHIQPKDWYWGDEMREEKDIPEDGSMNHWGGSDSFTKGDDGKAMPVFVPGYHGWRTRYNGLTDTVDLQFTGDTLDTFEVETKSTTGGNQWGGMYEFTFTTNNYEGSREIGSTVDKYRNWLEVTDGEVDRAMKYVGEEFFKMAFR